MSSFGEFIITLERILPHFTPVVAALAGTSVVVLVSGAFNGPKKILFQSAVFATSFAAATAYIMKDEHLLLPLWKAFTVIPDEAKFALSVCLIGGAYFGGALYIAGVNIPSPDSANNDYPATLDSVVTFDLPLSIPLKDKDLFEWMFDKLTREIVTDLPSVYEMPTEAVSWVENMIRYTVAGGKMNRGLATMDVHRTLATANGIAISDKIRCQIAALGWCVEFLQAFFLVADDLMDDSVTRRGQPCWYRLPNVRMIAINDSFILETCVFKILKKYFGGEAYYNQLVDLFIETTRQTEFGQLLDLTSQPLGGVVDLNRFTLDRYKAIVKYKTAFYSFYLPVALGMVVSGITQRSLFEKARDILCIMGEYFQIQDDYLDCYGDPEVIGKIGTDIQDNKCSWLVVQALQIVTPAQRQVLEENYGKHDERKVAAVKQLFNEINLKSVFEKYEAESYQTIQLLLQDVKGIPKEVFEFLLKKIYKRSK